MNPYYISVGEQTIRFVDSAGIIHTPSLMGTDSVWVNNSGFMTTWGMIFDGAGNLYVADEGAGCVYKVNLATNVVTRVVGNGSPGASTGDGGPALAAGFQTFSPWYVALDAAGNLYISDFGAGSSPCLIRAVNMQSTTQVLFGVSVGSGCIATVAGDITGDNGYSGDGGPATSALMNAPYAITVGPDGGLYIADQLNHVIRRVDPSTGVIHTVVGGTDNTTNGPGFSGDGGAPSACALKEPLGVIFDAAGNMIIVDTYNHRVRVINNQATTQTLFGVSVAAGTIQTIVGNGTNGFSGDGSAATSAEISLSWPARLDGSGNLYLCDNGNYRVRQISTAGIINTVAGNGVDSDTGDGGPATSAAIGDPLDVTFGAPGGGGGPPSLPSSGIALALRLTSVSVNDKFEVECVAEPFLFGLRTPTLLESSVPVPDVPNTDVDPGPVNAPIFFEATPELSGQSVNDILWIIISSANNSGTDPSGNPYSLYGGCIPYMSTDGGASYNPVISGAGAIFGNGTTGFTVGDWPAHADPDTVDDLSVDLTQSLGALDSYLVSQEDNFLFPCYVAGGGGSATPYELMTYAVANLTAAYKYTLKATGGGTNHLRRAVFDAPTCSGQGVDHPNGTRFAFLNPADSSQPGVLRMVIPPSLIGVKLYFKFPSFNVFGGGLETLSEAVAYPYTPTGVVSSGFQIGLAPAAPGNFTVGYCSASPAKAIIVQMTSGGVIWSQSPTLFDSINAYLAASDAAVTGIAIIFTTTPDAILSLAPGAAGNFSIAHGLATAPALALVEMTAPAPSAIWSQATEIDATNINLVAADAASTGKCYVWLAAPSDPGSNYAEVALAPSAAGNFTVAHGLPKAPTLVMVRMKSAGAIWIQSPASDGTNLYLTASDGGVTGVAEIWYN
jgi:sugar lactone lactonase YvrE